MKRALTPALILAAAASGSVHAQAPRTLNAFRDHSRVVLIFAADHDPRVEQQWAALVEHHNGAAERDIVTVLLTRSHVRKHDGEPPPQAVFAPTEEQSLRKRFHVSMDQFTVILIGKDGGEKVRSHQPIAWQTLADTIDAMPMRQAEMRHSR